MPCDKFFNRHANKVVMPYTELTREIFATPE